MQCCGETDKRLPCTNKAKHNYNGKALCTIHLRKEKMNEDCAICYEPLASHNRVMLGCGHVLHASCCRKWAAMQCAICRTPYNDSDISRILTMELEATLRRIRDGSHAVKHGALQILDALASTELSDSAVLAVDGLSRVLALSAAERGHALGLLSRLVQHAAAMGTCRGFLAEI